MAKTIAYYPKREIPVIGETDVLVVGGGPGGIGAAVLAGREGVSVILAERYGVLGGMAAIGEVHPFMPNHHGDIVMDRPVYVEWLEQSLRYLPESDRIRIQQEDPHYRSNLGRSINKEAIMLAAEDLCLNAGVKIYYHHMFVDAITENRQIVACIFASKSGLVAIRAKMYVDCSGDGDVAAQSGCTFEIGDHRGGCQPMTLCFKLEGVQQPPPGEARQAWMKKIQELYRQAQREGKISCPRENVLIFPYFSEEHILHFNTTRVLGKLGCNGQDLSEAELIAHQQVREYLEFFRSQIEGFERVRIRSMGPQIGVRETRRIRGLAYLTREAFTQRQKFPDAICRCNYGIDIHSPYGGGTELEHMPNTDYYEIPYGCIVPQDCDNLTVGGRPISVDVAIHSSMRVMPPACTVGQAAGLAAAWCVKKNTIPRNLDGVELRQRLREYGAYL